ncbi:uncharacterized protein LOC108667651 isoform X2 [Hyalella azteca]|uniref:Uncharacterized protein LOC108667651 isoform X2 n=1 Tax=Hyalella azteca TaxID=294128 RepID=A0A979FJP2_HYAAZ|nr:uncharacterized protein LOC108667651 isoform X2 [Hyalella azteca]
MHEEVVNPQMESVDPNDAEDVAQDGGLYPYCCDCSVLEPAGSGVNDFCRNCLLKEMSSVMQPPGLASVVVEEQSVTTGCDSERYTLTRLVMQLPQPASVVAAEHSPEDIKPTQ